MCCGMRRLFKKLKRRIKAHLLTPMDNLKETLKKLKKQAQAFEKNASQEVEKAKEFIRAEDREAAKLCLKRKSLYEQQIELLGNSQFQIEQLIIKLEGVKATTETVDALRIGAEAMQEMQKKINDGYKTMGETDELTANTEQIHDSLSTQFDEDKVEAELKELEAAASLLQSPAREDEAAAL